MRGGGGRSRKNWLENEEADFSLVFLQKLHDFASSVGHVGLIFHRSIIKNHPRLSLVVKQKIQSLICIFMTETKI